MNVAKFSAGAILAIACSAAAIAQNITVKIERSLLKDAPYTIIYPDSMKPVAATGDTYVVLQQGRLQCDLTITQARAGATTPTLATFDKAAAESEHRALFSDFTIIDQAVTSFQSGLAFMYGGQMTGHDKTPMIMIQAEAIDGGRRYVFGCLVARSSYAESEGLINFMIANVSTRSDGKCCTSPK